MIKDLDNKDGVTDATRGKVPGRNLISQTSCSCDLHVIAAIPPHVVTRHADAHSEPEINYECRLSLIEHLTFFGAIWGLMCEAS